MKPNATWDVQLPSFHRGNKSLHAISPLNTKMTEFDKFVPTLVIINAPCGEEGRRQKEMDEEGADSIYSITGKELYSSFTSA
jgi:hypothetical protein